MVVAETITPEVASLDPDGRTRMAAIVDTALLDRDKGTRAQLGTFLTVIRLAPILRYGRTFDGLDDPQGFLGFEGTGFHGLLRTGWDLE